MGPVLAVVGGDVIRKSTFSAPGMRAVLTRIWDETKPIGAFIGANPGRANAEIDDATARKYVGFGTRWGWGGYHAGNLYQWVATDTRDLVRRIRNGEPVNPPAPDSYLLGMLSGIWACCIAWGNPPGPIRSQWVARAGEVMALLGMCQRQWGLAIIMAAQNKGGSPAHLSRLPYTDRPIVIAA